MGATCKIKVDQFQFALRAYRAATKKDMADVLNRAARNVAYRAAQNTPAASAARIRSGLMRDPHLRYALASIALKKKGIGALKSPQFAKAVAKLVSRRASSAKYLRAGWAKAVEQLGGSFRGSRFKGADEGFANKATSAKLLAAIVNILSQPDAKHATTAEAVGLKALQKAIDYVAEDMINYAKQKMAQRGAEFSGR